MKMTWGKPPRFVYLFASVCVFPFISPTSYRSLFIYTDAQTSTRLLNENSGCCLLSRINVSIFFFLRANGIVGIVRHWLVMDAIFFFLTTMHASLSLLLNSNVFYAACCPAVCTIFLNLFSSSVRYLIPCFRVNVIGMRT